MGIPFYFATLLKAHAGIVQHVKQRLDVDVLGIDMNCFLHQQLNDADPFTSVLNALDNLLTNVCRGKTCFIALDGLVPYAKMVQQRYRRMRIPEGHATFDRNQLSPETPFMRQMEHEIRTRFPFVNLSPTSEPGEGEHKLFSMLRKLPNDRRKSVCIQGLDADLILLTLAHCGLSAPHSMYLLRETQEFGSRQATGFSTLNVWKLRSALPMPIEQYLALCILCFGNDFMPCLGMFSLREDGQTRAMSVHEKAGKPNLLVEEGRRKFLHEAGKQELAVQTERIRLRKRPEERAVLGKGEEFSRRQGLHVLDGVRNMTPVVEAYWKTFHWTLHQFRTNDVLDWNWQYPYPESPLVMDILKQGESKLQYRGELSYTTGDQLRFILPSRSLRIAKKRVVFPDEQYSETRNPWMKKQEWEPKPRVSLPWHVTDDLTEVAPLESLPMTASHS